MKHILREIKKDSALRDIFELFLKPYMYYFYRRTGDSSIEKSLDGFFHPETRRIVNVKAKEDFKLPGSKKLTENHALHGVAKPIISEGTVLTIRYDRTQPQKVEISVSDDVFLLTPAQYRSILKYIK